jgi:hypothetical protein
MKKIIFISVFFLIILSKLSGVYCYEYGQEEYAEENYRPEILLRLAYNVGVLAKFNDSVTDNIYNRFMPIIPEVGVNVQLYTHWYFSVAFDYMRLWGREKISPVGRYGNIFAPAVGVKYIAYSDEPGSDYFLDRSRWWVGLDVGCYITELGLTSPVNWSNTSYDFGFNVSTGFDYFFNHIFGAGFQAKIHYVAYSSNVTFPTLGVRISGDDYVIIQFGPHIIMRF